jgi:Putative transposase
MIVPGGGFSLDALKWIACRPRYFLTVEVLSALFQRRFLEMLLAAHQAGRLQFFGDLVPLAEKAAFRAYLAPLRKIDWVVDAREPFAGPRQVLRYLSRYTPRVAISNGRLLAADENGVTFRYKDYRIDGPARYKTMTLATDEFIRRFLIHVLPKRFHRIRHYGLLASTNRAANIARARELLAGAARARQGRRIRHCHLTIGLLAKLSAILMVHADRMGAVLWKRRIVDNPGFDRSMLLDRRQNQIAHFGQHCRVRPLRISNKMQQPLMLHRCRVRRRHRRNRLHAPAAF